MSDATEEKPTDLKSHHNALFGGWVIGSCAMLFGLVIAFGSGGYLMGIGASAFVFAIITALEGP